MSKYYPDISHHHPVGDWGKIKNNCPFIITKATEGTTYVDPTLDTVIKECEKRKIPYWLYTFLRDGNELAQAKFMVATCKNKVGKYFVGYILDVEQNNAQSNCQKALDYISGLGYKTMIYTMYAQYSLYKTLINERPKACAWWEARYGLNDGVYRAKYPCHPGVDFHQFTDRGSCPGISDKIDLNRLTGKKSESWFTIPNGSKKSGYSSTFPAIPPRGYYQIGDGYKTLTNYQTQIKRVQKLLNWLTGAKLKVDGSYGEKTAAAQKKAQKMFKLPINGKFGNLTLAKAKEYKK